MKKLLLLLFLCTGCVWGQDVSDSLTPKYFKKTIKELSSQVDHLIKNNSTLLSPYLDSISIKDTVTLQSFEDNMLSMEQLETQLRSLKITIKSASLLTQKLKSDYEMETQQIILHLLKIRAAQTDFFQQRRK